MFDTILLATCLLATDVFGVATNPCDDQYGQQELYYFGGNATVFNKTWRFDRDTSDITEYIPEYFIYGRVVDPFDKVPSLDNRESLCYGECVQVYQTDDYYGRVVVDYDPTVYSPAIDVGGYWDIHIIYATSAVSVGADNVWDYEYDGSDPDCTASYSTDSTLWIAIAVTHAVDPDFSQHIQNVTAPLTADAAATVELSFSVNSDPTEANGNSCFFDEIRICGTPITPDPTMPPSSQPSAAPTAAAPTEDSGNGVDRMGCAMTVVSVVFAILYGNM